MINALIVGDDAMVTELDRLYATRVPGFRCSGSVSTLSQAQEMISDKQREINLVLLNVYMQQDSGLDLLPTIHKSGRAIDAITITSAVDTTTMQTAMHYGVADYPIRPFQSPRFEEALTAWWEKHKLVAGQPYCEQADVDRLLRGGMPEVNDARKLSKGLVVQMLRTLCQWIDVYPDVKFSTGELVAAINISRVSCRKYLIWLVRINILYTTIHYGVTRRPVYRYRLVAEQYSLLEWYSQ